jgi:hypothetical protein
VYIEALLGARLVLESYSGTLRSAQVRDFAARQNKLLQSPDLVVRGDAVFPMLTAGWLAARRGDLAAANKALDLAKDRITPTSDAPLLSMRSLVEAEMALAGHRPRAAVALLRAHHNGTELYLSHAVLMRAYAADGNFRAALTEADWLAKQRGRAYAEWNYGSMLSAANVAQSNLALLEGAEFALKLAQPKLAQLKLTAFLRAWPNAEATGFSQERVKSLRARLKSAGL